MRGEKMHRSLKRVLDDLSSGKTLDISQAEQAFEIIMSGQAQNSQIGAFLMALKMRGETIDEITGAVLAMRSKVNKVIAPDKAIDIVGTGGDKSGTFNISTAAAFVVAGCGIPVAKHGNRAQSSKTGTADVLIKLGVNIDSSIITIERSIKEAGIGFMMAPNHHPAMRFVGNVRVELGTPTIFNLLGPLLNPAAVKRQSTGVFHRKWIKPMAESLNNLGSEMAWVVHGSDGLDELTTTGVTYVAELKNGFVKTFQVTPEDAGLPISKPEDLKGGDAEKNANALKALLEGRSGAYRDIVLLNAASALYISGKASSLKDGVKQARHCIDQGKAKQALNRLIKITN